MNQADLDKFYEKLKDFHTAMLVTASQEGPLRARPMVVANAERNAELWFLTGGSSPKVNEISSEAHVTVCFQKGDRYLSMSGTARIVRDRTKVDELWRPEFKPWFPNGKDDPELALIAVRPHEVEYWDSTGVNKLKFAWEVTKAVVTGDRAQTDDHSQHMRLRFDEPSTHKNATR